MPASPRRMQQQKARGEDRRQASTLSRTRLALNSARISWKEEELQRLLVDIMAGIHSSCVEYGGSAGTKHIDYVRGANIAGFKKVADAMLAYGVV